MIKVWKLKTYMLHQEFMKTHRLLESWRLRVAVLTHTTETLQERDEECGEEEPR